VIDAHAKASDAVVASLITLQIGRVRLVGVGVHLRLRERAGHVHQIVRRGEEQPEPGPFSEHSNARLS
jgi:hypothetical protein